MSVDVYISLTRSTDVACCIGQGESEGEVSVRIEDVSFKADFGLVPMDPQGDSTRTQLIALADIFDRVGIAIAARLAEL